MSKKEALKKLRTRFFESNCFESVKQPADLNYELSLKTYALLERGRLTRLLCSKAMTKQALYEQRLSATRDMHALCKRIESVPKSMLHKSSEHRFSEKPKKIKYSLRYQPKTCLLFSQVMRQNF